MRVLRGIMPLKGLDDLSNAGFLERDPARFRKLLH